MLPAGLVCNTADICYVNTYHFKIVDDHLKRVLLDVGGEHSIRRLQYREHVLRRHVTLQVVFAEHLQSVVCETCGIRLYVHIEQRVYILGFGLDNAICREVGGLTKEGANVYIIQDYSIVLRFENHQKKQYFACFFASFYVFSKDLP